MFRGLSPPNPSSADAMRTVMPEPAIAALIAVLISSFSESGAAPPMRISGASAPWKATAWVKPRKMTELRRGKLAS